MTELELLKQRAERSRMTNLQRLRDTYHYARSLGFNSDEARLLQGRNWAYIRNLAREAGNGATAEKDS